MIQNDQGRNRNEFAHIQMLTVFDFIQKKSSYNAIAGLSLSSGQILQIIQIFGPASHFFGQ